MGHFRDESFQAIDCTGVKKQCTTWFWTAAEPLLHECKTGIMPTAGNEHYIYSKLSYRRETHTTLRISWNVGFNRTITVINKLRLPPKLLMTTGINNIVIVNPRWQHVCLCQRTLVDADHRGGWTRIFVRIASDSGDFSTSRKMQLLVTQSAFGASVGVIPSEFCRDLLHHKTRVPGLSFGVVFEILCLAILIQYRLVTDKQTNGHAMTENTALA